MTITLWQSIGSFTDFVWSGRFQRRVRSLVVGDARTDIRMLRGIHLVGAIQHEQHGGHDAKLSRIDSAEQVVEGRSQQIYDGQSAKAERQ